MAPPGDSVPSDELRPWSIPKMAALCAVFYALFAALLFGLAGGLDFPWLWATWGTFVGCHIVMAFVLRKDPGLIQERFKPGPGEPAWDRRLLWGLGLVILVNLPAGPLDVGRYHWSDGVPVAARVAGLVGLVLGMALMGWAMAVNTFFSKVVRIQSERGHQVVDSGPYRVVRHPGYVGFVLLWLGFNLGIGSWLATGLSALVVAGTIYRTVREDRFLRENLPGYQAYAERVRWRLLPGLW